jgi:polar amino acid transport system substrate-binding protein|tara:strand:+ start:1656 stop:2417 length:762 start_codon:yes stop_codon:yes gene_type:complete
MFSLQVYYRFWTVSFILLLSIDVTAETVQVATGEFPPWTSESLPHGGYINRVVSSAFELSGIEVKFHYLPWKRALEATKVGQFHASSFWGPNKNRQRDLYHSDIIETDSFVFFHKKSFPYFHWQRFTDLSIFRIGATRGYTYSEEFWNLADNDRLRVSVANNDLINLKRLIKDEIDLLPLSKLTGHYLLNKYFSKNESAEITFNKKAINSGKDYILFSRAVPGNDRYLVLFNKGLKQLKINNTLQKFRRELSQ